MVGMGYSREEIHESLTRMKYDEITATYLLLGRKSTEVRHGLGYITGRSGNVGYISLEEQKEQI